MTRKCDIRVKSGIGTEIRFILDTGEMVLAFCAKCQPHRWMDLLTNVKEVTQMTIIIKTIRTLKWHCDGCEGIGYKTFDQW